MKHIAIASCYDKYNYGSVLQAYATQLALRELGVEAVTLDKGRLGGAIGKGRRSYYRRNLFNIDLYKAKMGFGLFILRRKIDGKLRANVAKRRKAFDAFAADHFDLSPSFSSFEDLGRFCEDFDSVVVGSDQLWLPVNIAGDYFTLSFVPDSVRKVSYATSFGFSQLPPYYMGKARQFLETFAAISVREDSGKAIIEELGLDAQVVCDPTMLLSREEWAAASEPVESLPDNPFILCYFLGNNPWQRECAKLLKQQTGCSIVALSHLDEYIASDDEGFADLQPYDVSPLQWVTLFKNASYVMTDSFHGSVFSSLFNRPFFAFRRHSGVGGQSTNSRLDTLLTRLALESRICESTEDFVLKKDDVLDFGVANARIAGYRRESLLWLKKGLGL